jgi:hypothetical protein
MKAPLTLGIALLASSFVIRHSPFLLAQGPLNPPGAPAPTLKTLDQVEARTPISSLPALIVTPGSYYLAADLRVSSGDGITINSDDVSLDLHGFTLSSTASPASGVAINITGAHQNVVVKNGHIRGTTTFAAGVFTTGGFLDGIRVGSAFSTNLRIADVNVHGVGDDAIDLATGLAPASVVERCTVSVCGGIGIRAPMVRHCSAEVTGASAILADIASGCRGESVGVAAGDHGIAATFMAKNCRGIASAGAGVQSAQVSNCRGTSTSGAGIAATQVQNSRGISTSAIGLSAANALNCQGESTSGAFGLQASSTAAFCRGKQDAGTAISAPIAAGCTVNGTGTVNSINKSLGTP